MREQWFFNFSSPSPLKWLNNFPPSITFSHHLLNIIFSFFPPSISSWKTKHIFFPQHPSFLEYVDFFLVPYNQPLLCNGWFFCKTKHFYNNWSFILSPITTLSFRMDGTFSFYLYLEWVYFLLSHTTTLFFGMGGQFFEKLWTLVLVEMIDIFPHSFNLVTKYWWAYPNKFFDGEISTIANIIYIRAYS